MKSHPRVSVAKILLAALASLALATEQSALAAIKYWDTNGTTAGAGVNPAGTWNLTTSNWTTDATGASAVTTFATGDDAVFSAGTDSTNAATAIITTALSANSILFNGGGTAGYVFSSGGTLTLGNVAGNTAITMNSGVGAVTFSGTVNIPNVGNVNGITTTFTNNSTGLLTFTGTFQNGNGSNIAQTIAITGSGTGGVTFNGALQTNNALAGTAGGINLNLSGGGVVTLNAAGGSAGIVTLSTGGSLKLGNALALQGDVLSLSGGTLDFGTQTAQTVAGLAGASNLVLTNASNAAVNLTVAGYGGANFQQNASSPTVANNISGLGGLTISGVENTNRSNGGTATYSGALTFSGNLAVNNAPSLGTTQNVASTVILSGTGDNIGGNVSITGSATNGAANLTVNNAITIGGTVSTSVSGTLNFKNIATVTGATTVGTGTTLLLNGASGAIATTPSITVNGGTLTADSTATANSNRIADAANVTLSNGANFNLIGNGATASVLENINALGFAGGNSTITISNPGAGQLATLNAASIARTNLSTGLVRGSNLGSQASNAGRVTLTSNAGLGLVGGSTTAGNKQLVVVPWLIADTSAAGTGSGFATYDSTANGLRPLATAEADKYTTTATIAQTAGNNVNVSAGTTTFSNSVAINSLFSAAASSALTGSNTTLTINSGAIAATTSTLTVGGAGGFSVINLDNSEGVVNAVGNIVIANPIDVTQGGTHVASGGLTKGGGGTLILSANNNLYSGATTVNQGTLQIGNGSTTGDLGSSSGVTLNTGTALTFNRTTASTYANTITGTGIVGGNTVTQAGTGAVTVGGISGVNAITQNVSSGGLSIGALTLATATTVTNNSAAGAITVTGATTAGSNVLTTAGTGITAFTGSYTASGGTATALVVGSGGTVFLAPTGSNTVSISATPNPTSNPAVTVTGTLNLGGDGVSAPLTTSTNTINAGTSTSSATLSGAGTLRVNSGLWTLGDFNYNGGGGVTTNNYLSGTATYVGGRYVGNADTLNVNGGTLRFLNTGSLISNANRFALGNAGTGTTNLNAQAGFVDIAKGVSALAQLGNENTTATNSDALFNQSGGTVQIGVTGASGTAGLKIGSATGTGVTHNAYTLTGGTLLVGGGITGALSTGGGSLDNFNFLGGTLTTDTFTAANIGSNSAATISTNQVASSSNVGTLENYGGTLFPGGNAVTATTTNGTTTLALSPRSGKTTIAGNYVVNSGALALNVAGTTASSAFQDAVNTAFFSNLTIAGTGVNTIGGNLLVNLIAGTGGTTFAPTNGSTFKIVSYTGAGATNSGTFSGNNIGATNLAGTNGVIAADGLTAFGITYVNTAGTGSITLGNATTNEWSAASGSNYNTLTSWTAMIPNTIAFIARFADAPTATGANAVNLDANETVQGLQFNSTARQYTISSSNSSTLTLDASAKNTVNPQTNAITVASVSIADSSAGAIGHSVNVPITLNSNLAVSVTNAANTLTIGGAIGENTPAGKTLTKTGVGTLVLSGSNSYTGGTTIGNNSGILQATNVGAFGTGTVTNTTTNGATTQGTVQLNIAGGSLVAPNVVANAFNFNSQYLLNHTPTAGFADIENVGGFNQITGNLTLTGTGGSGPNIVSDAGNLELRGTLSSTLVNGNARVFDFGGAGNGLVTGTIRDVSGAGSGTTIGVQKDGAGTWTLSAANSYTGATTINGGTLSVTANENLGSTVSAGGITFGGGTLLIGETNTSFSTSRAITLNTGGGTLDSGDATNTAIFAGNVANGANPFTLQGSGAGTLRGVIGNGAGTLTKAGAGQWTLTGLNTYTGATTISAGTLQIGDGTTDGSITSSASVVDNGSLIYNRTSGSSFTYGNVISGSGTVTKAGPGAQILSGANTYTGATTISGGSLVVATGGSLSGTSAASVASGAVLELNGALNNAALASVDGKLQGNGGTLGPISVTTTGSIEPGRTAGNVNPAYGTISGGAVATANLSATTLTLASTATYVLNINPGGTSGFLADGTTAVGQSSLLNLSGQLTLNNAALTLNDLGLTPTSGQIFKFISYVGSAPGTFTVNGTVLNNGDTFANGANSYQIFYAAGDPFVELVAVPEPGTWAMVLCGAALLVGYQRVRRRV